MKTKEDYNNLLIYILQEKNILGRLHLYRGQDKANALNKLEEIRAFKTAFYPCELQSIYEIMKPETDLKTLTNSLKECKKILPNNNIEFDSYNEEEEEFSFIAWLFTVMITKNFAVMSDLKSQMIYQVIKSVMKDDTPTNKNKRKF